MQEHLPVRTWKLQPRKQTSDAGIALQAVVLLRLSS